MWNSISVLYTLFINHAVPVVYLLLMFFQRTLSLPLSFSPSPSPTPSPFPRSSPHYGRYLKSVFIFDFLAILPWSTLYAVTANASLHFLGALKALYAGTSNASLHELCLRLGSFKLLPSCAGVCVCPCVCTPHEACMSDVRTRTWALTTCCAHLLLYPVN